MANRYANLPGPSKIKDTYDRINVGFDKVQQDVDGLQSDLDKEITDREQAVQAVNDRVSEIIQGGGPDKDAELVDIRTPDPSYTPQRTINVAGDLTRDIQAQFMSHKADTVTRVENIVDGHGADPTGSTNSADALFNACLTGNAVYIPYGTYIFNLSTEQVKVVVNALDRIRSENIVTINLASGVQEFDGAEIARVGQNGANLRIEGADPVETSITGVASVSGEPGNFEVTYNLADATGIEVGDVLFLSNITPGKVYSSASDTRRPYDNELAIGFYKMGTIATTGNTCTLSTGGQSTHLAVGDLIHVKGQTRRIVSIDPAPARTFTVDSAWDLEVAGYQWWYYTKPGVGTCGTAGASRTDVDFSNTVVPGNINEGDLLIASGQIRKIVGIVDNNTVTVSHAISLPTGTPYSVVSAGILHEGSFPVIGVNGNQVTVVNRNRYAKPPRVKINHGDVKALKTVLKNISGGNGIVFERGGVLNELKNIALQGDGTAIDSVGLALNGTGSSEYNVGSGACTITEPCAVIEWGVGARLTSGCTLYAMNSHICNNSSRGVDCSDGAVAYLRGATVSYNGGIGLFVGGGYARISAANFCGNTLQGIRQDVGSGMYGDMPIAWGNGHHGIMLVNYCGAQFVDGVSACNGGNGANFQNSAGGRVSRTLFVGNADHQLSVTNGKVEATQCWITGSFASKSGTVVARSEVDLLNAAITGNGANGVLARTLARVYADGTNIRGSGSFGLQAESHSIILAVDGRNTDSTNELTGGTVITE